MNWLDIFAKVAPGVAALSAALVARAGLNTWKRQLKGQAEYDLARRVLRGMLRVRDEMNAVRHPMISGGEFAAAYKEAGLDMPANPLDVSGSKGSELVYERRWRRVVAAMTELEAELLEAEVLWGAGSRQPEVELRRCVGELYVAISTHARMLASANPHKSLTDLAESQFRVLYRADSSADPDVFGRRIDATVKDFEGILRPHLASSK